VPEPLKFYVDLVLSPMQLPSTAGRWRLTVLVVAAQLATLVGALREALTWPWSIPARDGNRRVGGP
jgi:hypothetical protein